MARFYVIPVALFEAQFCELLGQPASIQSFSFWLHDFTPTFAYSELRQHKQMTYIDFNDDQGISHLNIKSLHCVHQHAYNL